MKYSNFLILILSISLLLINCKKEQPITPTDPNPTTDPDTTAVVILIPLECKFPINGEETDYSCLNFEWTDPDADIDESFQFTLFEKNNPDSLIIDSTLIGLELLSDVRLDVEKDYSWKIQGILSGDTDEASFKIKDYAAMFEGQYDVWRVSTSWSLPNGENRRDTTATTISVSRASRNSVYFGGETLVFFPAQSDSLVIFADTNPNPRYFVSCVFDFKNNEFVSAGDGFNGLGGGHSDSYYKR